MISNLTELVEIGRGGFGVVYQARQVDLGRLVAVKVLPDVRGDTEAYGRFARECQALAALGGHPNIATVFGCGLTEDGAGYLSLELLPGGSLADRIAGGASDWAAVAAWGVQLAGALETAHRAGITHRDIKPENVLFDGLATPKLVDFGIAGVPGAFRTATGAVTLTLAHAAPEVVAGGRGGVPGDVYALASTLYAALAGGAAFVAAADETLVPMLARIASAPVPDLRPRGVPDAVCTAIERGMAKDPADRPTSAEGLGMALQAALAGEGVPVPSPPLLLLPTGIAASITGEHGMGGADSVSATQGSYAGDRTLTGWTPAAAAAAVPLAVVAAEAMTSVVPPPAAVAPRRRVNGWALVASVAIVALAFLAFRGIVTPSQAVGGSSPATSSGSPHASPTPSPRTSASARPGSPTATPSTPARTSTAPGLGAGPVAPTGSSRGSTAPAATHSTPAHTSAPPTQPATTPPPSTTPSASPTPTPVVVPPGPPRGVRAAGATFLPAAGGIPAQVALNVSWLAPSTGTLPTAYELQWTVVGGPQSGTTTAVPWTSATKGRVLVPAPPGGTWYRWQVRATTSDATSAWVVARAVMPKVVGRRAAQARAALRALGIPSSTYTQVTTVPASVGRVVAQSLPPGRVVVPDTPVALGIGKAP